MIVNVYMWMLTDCLRSSMTHYLWHIHSPVFSHSFIDIDRNTDIAYLGWWNV